MNSTRSNNGRSKPATRQGPPVPERLRTRQGPPVPSRLQRQGPPVPARLQNSPTPPTLPVRRTATAPAPRSASSAPTRSTPTQRRPAAPQPPSNAGMKNQDKNYKGSSTKNALEDIRRMKAASLSRQQGRSNITGADLKATPAGASKAEYNVSVEEGNRRLGVNGVGPTADGDNYSQQLKIKPTEKKKDRPRVRRRNEF